MSEIISFRSSPDQTLNLGCEITDFYPPNISVTWLKLGKGEKDDTEEEVIEGGEIWGPVETHTRLYRATATLKRRTSTQEKKERGGGVICRVEHTSLVEPIEKHWRGVEIGMNKILFQIRTLYLDTFSFFCAFCLYGHSGSIHSSIDLSVLEQRRCRRVLSPVEGRSPKSQITLGSRRTHALTAGVQ